MDVTFGAWIYRTAAKAAQAGKLSEREAKGRDLILTYLDWRSAGDADVVKRLAREPVPLLTIPPELAAMAQFGLFPKWDGYEAWAARIRSTPDEPGSASP